MGKRAYRTKMEINDNKAAQGTLLMRHRNNAFEKEEGRTNEFRERPGPTSDDIKSNIVASIHL